MMKSNFISNYRYILPTPVSALIHAATLVTAGIYLMVRLGPFMAGSDLIILVGCLTAFMAGVFGFFQADLKRVIAFSTCSQLGCSTAVGPQSGPTANLQAKLADTHIHTNIQSQNQSQSQSQSQRFVKYQLYGLPRLCCRLRVKAFNMLNHSFSTLTSEPQNLLAKLEPDVNKNIIPENYVDKFEDLSVKQRYIIKTKYKNKLVVYLWQNKVNGKCYVGSSVNFSNRLANYFDSYYLNRVQNKMPICSALLLYGYANFNLYVLEVLQLDLKSSDVRPRSENENKNNSNLRIRESYFVSLVKPSYNIAAVLN